MKKTAKPLTQEALGLLARITPRSARSMMTQAVAGALLQPDKTPLQALGEAICAYPDEAVREAMGAGVRAGFEVLRLGKDPGRREALAKTAHIIVTVPFVLEGDGPIKDRNPLNFITGRIDSELDAKQDPNGARIPGMVLAVPARCSMPTDLVALNYMLSNPDSSTVDAEYARWWMEAMKTTLVANQSAEELPWHTRQAFFYAFSMAVPDMTPAQAMEAPLSLTPYGQEVVSIIMNAVDRANRESDKVKIRLLEVQKLSDGIVRTQLAAIRKAIESSMRIVDDMRTPETPEDPVVRMVVGTELTWNPMPAQFFCVSLIGESGAYRSMMRLLPSHGFPRALAEAECAKICEAKGFAFNALPPQVVHHYPKNELGVVYVRAEDGQWYDPSLLTVGPQGKSILRTGEWAIGWDDRFRQPESEAFNAELQALPDPVRQSRVGLKNVFGQHYTPGFLRDFTEVASRPGISREACMVALIEEKGHPLLDLVNRGHGKQVMPNEQMYAGMHFEAARGVLFVVREPLLASLAETDLTDDYPLEGVRAPFPDCYFHYGQPLRLGDLEGALTIEGFYVSEENFPEDEEGPEERRITILPVVSEGEALLSLTSEALHMNITPGDGQTLQSLFSSMDAAATQVDIMGLDKQPVMEFFKDFWRSLVKVLLYTTLRDHRRRDAPERTTAMEAAKQKQDKERQRALDAAAKLYDFISIGPENAAEDDSGLTGHPGQGTRKQHVRRGSIVWQPYGPQHSLRRTQWRRPTIVNRTDGEAPEAKTYIVE